MGRLTPSPEARSISDSYLPRGPHSRCDKAIGWRGCLHPYPYPTGTPDLGNRSPTTPPRESVANADNKLSTGFTPKTPEQTLHEDACDVSLFPIGSPFASPMQPAPLLNSKGNLATPEFPNEDSNPMEASRSLEASFSEDSLLSSEKSNPSSTSTPIDSRALYDNKFALLYKEDEELNDPAFQARKREEKQKRAQEIAAAPLRDYCMQVKRQLEAECNGNMSGNLEIEIPEKIPQGSKKSQPGMGAYTTPNRKLAENASESTTRNKRKDQENRHTKQVIKNRDHR